MTYITIEPCFIYTNYSNYYCIIVPNVIMM